MTGIVSLTSFDFNPRKDKYIKWAAILWFKQRQTLQIPAVKGEFIYHVINLMSFVYDAFFYILSQFAYSLQKKECHSD